MKVLFDCRYTRIGTHDGISRFTASLVEELAKLHPVELLISDEAQLTMLPELPWHLIAAPTSPLEPLVARRVNKLKPDIVFTPMQTMGSMGRHYRLVTTVHDLIYYRFPKPPRNLPWYVRVAWRLYHLSYAPQRMLLNAADAVVAVSATTKELIAEHRLTKRPVFVVRNAAGEPSTAAEEAVAAGRTAPASISPSALPTGADAPHEPRSIVHMGQFLPYKNIDALVRAMEYLPGYELQLLSRVTDAERARLLALLSPETAARVVFRDGVSDAEYEAALLGAQALVSTSWDEGFGIPLLEAMRLGTPVVASDIPIFREVGGAAAVFVDPAEPGDVARGIRSLEDADEWQRRSQAAIEQAATFSWAASAQHLLTVLTSVYARAKRRPRRPSRTALPPRG